MQVSEKGIETHIISKNLFTKKDKLLVGVSGGIDSVVLSYLLKKLDYKFSIAHCNFNLRGKESENDERFCTNLAKKYNVTFYIKRFDTKKYANEKKISIQMAARELRYQWFQQICEEFKLKYIITAHHLNDQLETVLLNFTRGTGLLGLTGIPERQGNIVRPLLEIPKEKIQEYAKYNKIKFREDSSNYDEKYSRNLIRKQVLTALKKINPSLEKTTINNLNNLKESLLISRDFLQKKIKLFKIDYFNHINKIKIDKLKKETHLNFIMHGILSKFGFNTSQIETAKNLVYSESGKQIFNDNYIILKDRENLIIQKKELSDFKEELIYNFPYYSTNLGIVFKSLEPIDFDFEKNINITYLDFDKIQLPLKIRKWKQGDRFYPEGMTGSKKLSDYFVSIKASRIDKDSALILESGKNILWVIGKRKDRRFLANQETKKIIVAEFIPIKKI